MVKRDELAIEFQNAIWRLEPYKDPPDEGMCFKHGFHAAIYLLLPEIEKFRESLLRLTVRLDESASIHDIKPSAEIVSQTLESLREFLGEKSEGEL